MTRPLVGIVPIYDQNGFGGYKCMTACFGYMEACGAAPVLLPCTDDAQLVRELAQRCDGVVMAGGHDVSPLLYGRDDAKIETLKRGPESRTGMFDPHYVEKVEAAERAKRAAEQGHDLDTIPEDFDLSAVYVDPKRDCMEWMLMEYMLDADKPIFGICRGLQSLNVYFGGTLWTDIPRERPDSMDHSMCYANDDLRHDASLVAGTPLQQLMGAEQMSVNTYHHQAVRELGQDLQPMAWAPDGVLEAAWAPSARFVWAVQWHPESMYEVDEASMVIGRRFVQECES